MKVLAFFEFGNVSAARWQWVQRCWALFGLSLILATWRLWSPQNVYPQVPFFRVAGSLPAGCQWGALAVVIVVLVIILGWLPRLNDGGRAWLFLTFVVAMALLILTDQHRLQPWAYQLVICAVVFGTVPSADTLNRRRGWALLRILTLSIYLFSALGKVDFQFLNTVGQQFLSVGLGNFGISIDEWHRPFRLLLAAAFPLAEISVVIALTVPRLRRVGVAATVLLHLVLLFVLGPMGLQHQPGVLIWNGFFIAQALLLFSGSQRSEIADEEPNADERTRHRWAPTCVVLAVVVLPLLEPIGWFDHWPAWGLYSPRNSRAIVEVHQAGLRKLPPELHRHLSSTDSDTMWVKLNIDDWSLASLSVPIYPQNRFQLGVAEAIATRYDLERTIQVRLLGMSNRVSGVREEKTLTGRHQIVLAANRFRLNAHPADPLDHISKK